MLGDERLQHLGFERALTFRFRRVSRCLIQRRGAGFGNLLLHFIGSGAGFERLLARRERAGGQRDFVGLRIDFFDDDIRHAVHEVIAGKLFRHCVFYCQRRFPVRREIGLIAEMPAAANHRQVHADLPAERDDREDIDVVVAAHFDRLLVQHGGQCELIWLRMHGRGLFELEIGGERVHLLLELLHHFALASEQESRCVRHIACVILLVDQADGHTARCSVRSDAAGKAACDC